MRSCLQPWRDGGEPLLASRGAVMARHELNRVLRAIGALSWPQRREVMQRLTVAPAGQEVQAVAAARRQVLAADIVLCTDGSKALARAARHTGVEQRAIDVSASQHALGARRINNGPARSASKVAARLRGWLRRRSCRTRRPCGAGDERGRDQPHGAAVSCKPACPVKADRAGLHGSRAPRHRGDELVQLAARLREPHQRRLAVLIDAVHRKHVVGETDADEYDRYGFPFRRRLMRNSASHRCTAMPYCA